MTRTTKAQLESKLAEVQKLADDNYENGRKWRTLADEREKQVNTTREQFADLKKRLHNSEVENARLNGYLARVREDDTVREELVAIGSPDGEQRLVPKRKHELMRGDSADVYEHLTPFDSYGQRREKPKHWIEY